MNKLAPTWFWIAYGFIFTVAIIAFTYINMSVGAFFIPISKLPLIYWLLLSTIIILLAVLLAVIFAINQRSQATQPRAAIWVVIISNAFGSAIFYGIALLDYALPNLNLVVR